MPLPVRNQLAEQIVDTLKTICSHDINFIDPQGRITASTDPVRVNTYHAGGHAAARSGEVIILTEDDPAQDMRRGINMPIRFHGSIFAVIGITGDPEEVKRYADLAQRITLLLLREHEIEARNYDIRSRTGHLVRSLIEGETMTQDYIREVLEQNRIPFRTEAWKTILIRVQKEHEKPLSTIEAAVSEIAGASSDCLYAYLFPQEFVFLIRDRDSERWAKEMNRLAGRFPGDLKIGLGSAHRLSRQDLSCAAARLVVQSLEPGKNYADYGSLQIEILLAGVSDTAGRAYVEKCLRGLNDSDRELLGIYFASDLSLKETAAQCFLHINTLQYRLKRIWKRCGLDPRRFRDASLLYTALRMEKLKTAEGSAL